MKARKILYALLAIVLTLTIAYARRSYELMLQEPDDIFNHSLDLFYVILLITPFILAEIEVFHFILYFISDKRKRKPHKIVLNIIALLLSFGSVVGIYLDVFTSDQTKTGSTILLLSLLGYSVIKIIHFIVWSVGALKIDWES